MSSHRVADMIRPKEHIFPSLHHTDADWSVKRDPEWIIFRFDEIEECNSVWCGEQRYTADVCACIKCSMLSLPESLKSQNDSEPWSCTSRSDSREYFASSVFESKIECDGTKLLKSLGRPSKWSVWPSDSRPRSGFAEMKIRAVERSTCSIMEISHFISTEDVDAPSARMLGRPFERQ